MKKLLSIVIVASMLFCVCAVAPVTANAATVKEKGPLISTALLLKERKAELKQAVPSCIDDGEDDYTLAREQLKQSIDSLEYFMPTYKNFITEESYEKLSAQLEKAKAVYNTENLPFEAYDFANNDLAMCEIIDVEIIYNNAYLQSDLDYIQQIIDKNEQSDIKISKDGIAQLEEAKKEGQALLDKGNATEQEIYDFDYKVYEILMNDPGDITDDYTKQDLQNIIDIAQATIDEGHYFESQLVNLNKAIANAQQVINNESATAEEIEIAWQGISDELDVIYGIITVYDVQYIIEQLEALASEGGVEFTVEQQQAISHAKELVAKQNPTQQELEDCYNQLWDIYDAVVATPYQALIDTIALYQEDYNNKEELYSTYTKESADAFILAYENAVAVKNTSNPTDDECYAAIDALDSAYYNLDDGTFNKSELYYNIQSATFFIFFCYGADEYSDVDFYAMRDEVVKAEQLYLDENATDEQFIAMSQKLNSMLPQQPEGVMGDFNSDGDVTITDVTAIQKFIADMDIGDNFYYDMGDVDYDGEITIKDATLIQKYIAEEITDFPAAG